MKLAVFLTIFFALHAVAESKAQKITLHVKNTPLGEVMRQFQKQQGYSFLFYGKHISDIRVDAQLKHVEFADAMDMILTGQGLDWSLEDGIVTITKRPSLPSSGRSMLQQRTVTGKVTDEDGNPLEGVTVTIKETNAAITTNEDGDYQIQLSEGGETLVYSIVGFEPFETPITSENNIDVSLKGVVSDLDEVVVVGFGQQKKETVTGSIASIRTKDVKQSPAANLAVSLAGRLPGLTALQRSGEPGNDVTNLYIRGRGTVNSQSPIVLVDGVERELTYIDPNEVESVTILKDVSSTAIFGVRGANGVILVTTRRGTSETPEINFTTEMSAQDFPRFFNFVDAYEHATLRNLAQNNDGLGGAFSAEALEKYRTGIDPTRYPNTDWTSILLKDYAPQQRYNLNVSGAGKRVKYFINAGYLNQGGQFKTEKDLDYDPSFRLDRYNFRSNIDVDLNKNLRAYLNLAGYLERQNTPTNVNEGSTGSPVGDILGLMMELHPTNPGPVTPDGKVLTHTGDLRPAYGLVNRLGYTQTSSTNIAASYGMEQKLDFITEGLSAKAMLSFDTRAVNRLVARRDFERWIQVVDPNLKGADGQDSVYYQRFGNMEDTPLAITGNRNYITQSNVQAFVEYNRSLGNHDVSGLLLYQQQKNISNEALPYNLIGFASRMKYGYSNRYFFEFNAGFNGSEQFAPGRRFGFFPAVSGAWMVSNESFWPSNNTVDQLKFRASYGEVGNDRIGGRRFLYLDDIQVGGGGFNGDLGRGQKVNINLLGNPYLKWEVAKKRNIGIEVGLFNALDVVVDVFHERRDNVLRDRGTVPVLNGFPNAVIPPVNLGVIENKGYEAEITYRKVFSSDFSLLSRVNISYASNRQLFADEPLLPDSYAFRYRQTGYPIGQQFGYIIDRYFTDDADIEDSPTQTVGGGTPKPGDFKYKDLNNDGVVNERDISPIGYSNVPEYTFGAAFSINYKSFDVSALVQGISNVTNFYSGHGVFPYGTYLERHLNSWTPERHANGEPVTYPRLTTGTSPSQIANSFFVLDGSYIRLKNAEVGYTLSHQLTQRVGIRSIRVYANGLNLVTWDRMPTNDIDPEQTTNYTYPLSRIYNLGVNIVF